MSARKVRVQNTRTPEADAGVLSHGLDIFADDVSHGDRCGNRILITNARPAQHLLCEREPFRRFPPANLLGLFQLRSMLCTKFGQLVGLRVSRVLLRDAQLRQGGRTRGRAQ